MSNDTTLVEEAPPERPEESAPQAEITKLATQHADRVRELEADRWRLSERIEALENQNAEIQAGFLDQTSKLQAALKDAKESLASEQQRRLESAVLAAQQETERVETVRRDLTVELKRHEARAEKHLEQLLEAKDALFAQAQAHQQALTQQQAAAQTELSALRRELDTELSAQGRQLRDTAQQLAATKSELTQARRSFEDAARAPRPELDALLAEEKTRADQAERELGQAALDLKAQQVRLRELELRARQAPAADPGEAVRLRRSLSQMEAEAQRQRIALASLESRAEKTKETLSFRLGYLLIHAPKSWQSLRRLPTELLDLHQDAKRRRERRRGVTPDATNRASSRPKRADEPRRVEQSSAKVVDATRDAELFGDETMRLFLAEGWASAARFAEFGASNHHESAIALTRLAKAIKTSDPQNAKRLAQQAYALEPLPFRAKWLAFVQYDAGEIRAPALLLSALPPGFTLKPSEKARVAEILGLARLQTSLPGIPARAEPAFESLPKTSLYAAASALPFHVSGYAVRTHQLLRAIQASGWQVRPTLRPGYPADRGIEPADGSGRHELEGITYEHLAGPHLRKTGLDEFLLAAADAITEAARRARPAVIHAASNHVNSLPALIAARRLGLPFVYEVRGLWELTAATRNVDWEQTERFELERALETHVAKHADHVLTLTEGLANELAARGVPRENIDILPNSVDPALFAPRRKDPEQQLRLGVSANSFTLVYAGSLLHYEGLDDLVRAVAALVAAGVDTALVVAGDGEALDSLQRLCVELGVERRVKFLGRIDPRDIPELWSVADAAAFPRKPFEVCQLVSPLKPLEPMAMGIPVVVSDVAALREMVQDRETGLVHRAGDVASLTERLRELASDPALRQRLGQAAREAVLRERTWQRAAERVVSLYRRLELGQALHPVPLSGGGNSMTAEEKLDFEARLAKAYAHGGAEAVRELATRQAGGRSDRLLAFCLLKAASCCQHFGDASALQLAQDALKKDAGATTLRGAARVIYAAGDFDGARSVIDRLEHAVGTLGDKDQELAREIRGRVQLLEMLAAPAGVPAAAPISGRSVYFLHFSLPYTSVGYATRSHGLIGGMQAAGCDVRVYTRSGFPFDFKPELEGQDIPSSDVVDGVEYHRVLESGRRGNSESEYLLGCVRAYERVLREEQPEVVHAASNYVTALPALIAARRLGLPFIYEIRGFWEITRSSRDSEFENSTRYALMRHFEGLVTRHADHVFTLTSAMKEELMRRGVEESKITLVHNGVDPERFVPAAPQMALAERLGLPSGVPVIGYVGSFVDYEGLDDLVTAGVMLARRGIDFRMLLVGDGAELPRLRELVVREGVADRVLLTGRVPHDEVEAYYSLIDICPFPRKPWEVCEMVSPLKPFEAMAMEKAVVVSSTHALREIVEDGENGLVFEKGSASSLAASLERLLADTALRKRLARAGRAWTLQNRTWGEGGRVVVEGYRALLSATAGDTTRVTA